MSVTQEQLNNFHQFASDCIRKHGGDVTFDDLVIEWDSYCCRSEINEEIRAGLADIEAGRFQDAFQVTQELRKKYSIPE